MGIGSFQDSESSDFQHLNSRHPNEDFVLDNQNDGFFLHAIRALSLLLARNIRICGTRQVDNAPNLASDTRLGGAYYANANRKAVMVF